MINFGCNWLRLVSMSVAIVVSFSVLTKLVYPQEPPRVNVRLQVFSGMPNPEWFFDDPDDLVQLRSFVKGLPEAAPVEEPQFGSFLLRADEAKCRFPERVLVFDGVIKATTADGITRFFRDTKGFEDFLRAEAVERGFEELLP